jgi:hypothetical protein
MRIDSSRVHNPFDQVVRGVWPAADKYAIRYLLQWRAHETLGAPNASDRVAASAAELLDVTRSFRRIAADYGSGKRLSLV